MIHAPGFSSRSVTSGTTQFPQRDEAAMSELEPGFSNSKAVDSDETDAKVVGNDTVEDKAVKKSTAKRASK